MSRSDHQNMETKSNPRGSRGSEALRWLRVACVGGLLLGAAVACKNEPSQTTEPMRPGAAGGSNVDPGASNRDYSDTTRGMGSGQRTASDGTHAAPLSGSGSGNPGASSEIQRTSGDDPSEPTGTGGSSGKSGGGHGGSAGHGGRGGSAGKAGH